MIDLKALFEADVAERYKVPLLVVQEQRDGESYNIDSRSIFSHLHWEWQAWKRCHESLTHASMVEGELNAEQQKIIKNIRELTDKLLPPTES
ncbi:hypothetical protein [Xenorhabdus sp. KJ12.1]|uniref:hypothetical protein n=1 Tax=Xenorhabdus sp. KJ12.1 TaxID=1851571 RepID=UPI000C03F491|nr:hypothetical protein [Xenorhabdus sp. KJ12.1]PHM72316.1 hypothetical protein Xekj_00594 [Xenorhabdus sp. KJ12.1]